MIITSFTFLAALTNLPVFQRVFCENDKQKFCLHWNEFESNISIAFRELRDDKDFFDVTLACDDDQIQAHKVILSACYVEMKI